MDKRYMTYEECRRWLDFDPDAGVFTFTGAWKGRSGGRAGEVAGSVGKGGRGFINVGGMKESSARLACLWITGSFPEPGMDVDHINGNPGDDRWCNLRPVTHKENTRNAKMKCNNTSGIQGVNRIKDYYDGSPRWVAKIKDDDGKDVHLYQGRDFFEACCRRKSAENRFGYHCNHGRVGALA